MSYSNGLNFLETHTKVLELSNEFGARIAVCPHWNGRVMTSTCTGLDGDSYGLIDVSAIESQKTKDASSSGFGGENHFTLAPDGGPFSVYYSTEESEFSSDSESVTIPTGFVEGPFEVDINDPARAIRMRRSLSLTNLSGAKFDLNVIRSIRILSDSDLSEVFPSASLVALEHPEVSFVSYETVNTLVNTGAAFCHNSGLLSIRLRCMLNAAPFSTMMIPYRPGNEDELGPPIQSDFFGHSSRKKLHLLPEVAILRADGLTRGIVGVSRRRALPYCAAIDFRSGVLTIINFNLPMQPSACAYMSNEFFETRGPASQPDFVSMREHYIRNLAEQQDAGRTATPTSGERPNSLPQFQNKLTSLAKEIRENDPYAGEVVRAYNHGPLFIHAENPIPYFELDTFSPARELKKGESLTHTQYTTHICADSKTLGYLARTILKIDVSRIYEKMLT